MGQRCNPLSDSLASSTTFPVVEVLAPWRALHCGMKRKTQATITHFLFSNPCSCSWAVRCEASAVWTHHLTKDAILSTHPSITNLWRPVISSLRLRIRDTNWPIGSSSVCRSHSLFQPLPLCLALSLGTSRFVIRSCLRGDLSSWKNSHSRFLNVNFPTNNFL